MSRYSKPLPDGRTVVWGWDNPLQEYFLEVYRAKWEMVGLDPDDDVLFAIGSETTLTPHPAIPDKTIYTNIEMAKMMDEYQIVIPLLHIASVRLGVPF
jgi:hypothetical protein